MRSVDHETFLDALAPELDRIDALDGSTDATRAGSSTLDRLADRLERGYESTEAQSELDTLVQALQDAASGLDGDRRGEGQRGRGRSSMRPTRSAAADRVRRTLFQGGGQSSDAAPATGAWTDDEHARDIAQKTSPDLQILEELEQLERELGDLERIGSVTELGEVDLASVAASGGEIGEWLSEWSAAVEKARSGSEGRNRISLPPEVIRSIGRELLKGLFNSASSHATGEHHATMTGNAGDPVETTRAWEPGKPLDLNLVATLSNAIRRPAHSRRKRLRLISEDFAVVERSATVAVSTVLAIDRSRSMGQSGAWIAAKKVSLAMHELIRQSYPRDSLDVIAFSSGAERVPFEAIPEMRWDEFEHGTHLQAALELGRRIHRRSRAGTRQIVVITDGEPTVATVGDERVFASPPSQEVLNATMAEVIRCTRENIVINVVILGTMGTTSTFAEQIARVNRGRIFVSSNDSLGAYVLRDYVAH